MTASRATVELCHLPRLFSAGSQTDIFVHHELVEITDRENCVNSKLCKQERALLREPKRLKRPHKTRILRL